MNFTNIKTFFYTAFALLAFAANSIFCRLALEQNVIDAASFTVIRLVSGICFLACILLFTKKPTQYKSKGSWFSSVMLFLYAISFSYAYISLDTATGALILFATVQITMILFNLFQGNRLHYSEWSGVLIAFAGFVYLILPDITTPSFKGFILMLISGIAWAGYTLRGKQSQEPIIDTTYNFLRTLPFVLILFLVTINHHHLSQTGVLLAILSGAIASGAGYTVWYIAVKALTLTQAAVVQLLVPVIAAVGGILFVDEILTLRLVIASILILGGILLVVTGRYYSLKTNTEF